MPVIAVNLAPSALAEILRLVEQQLYATPQQFLEVAAQNQLALEQGARAKDLAGDSLHVDPAEAAPPPSTEVQTPAAAPEVKKKFGGGSREPVAPSRKAPDASKRRSHTIKRRSPVGRRQAEQPTPAIAEDVLARISLANWATATPTVVAASPRPPDDHIFGQVNKALPMVFAVRWIGVEASLSGEWPRVTSATDQLGDDAATLGSALEATDSEAEHTRDDLLATGLPRRGNSSSKDRFISQFVARATRSGEILPGAVCQYALACVQEDRLVLTSVGLELAKLANPILDEGKREQPTLSGPERDLLVRCVWNLVPAEAHDFRTLLASIAGGHDTPTDLVTAMRPSLPEQWSDVAVRTHISGVTARAAELDLIRRRWEGRFVKYEITNRGSSLAATRTADLKDMGF